MDFYGTTAIKFGRQFSAIERLSIFFGHYDCRVYLTETAFVDVGAGSLRCAERVTMAPLGHVGSLGTIGRFCEFNDDTEVMVGGAHDNDLPVNVTFTGIPILQGANPHGGAKDSHPISIGNGVVMSAGAKILSGVRVGDGAVIGAGAIVTRDVEPFSIVAGVPARELRKRSPAQPWWDFHPAYLLSNLAKIQQLALSEGPHEWRQDRPRFVVRLQSGGLNLDGFLIGDEVHPFSQAPPSVQKYVFNNIHPDGSPYWMADCWAGVTVEQPA